MTSCRVPIAGLALVASAAIVIAPGAFARDSLDTLIAKHAATHNVPESLVRRVIHIESRGNPRAVSKGNYGLMQIRLGTARALGYRGDARGLLDADTNMAYAVKYLAGAYRVAGCNPDRAIRNYQRGYHGVKRYKCATPGPGATQIASAAGGTEMPTNASSTVVNPNEVLKPRVVQTVAISRRDMELFRTPRAAATAPVVSPPIPVARPKLADRTVDKPVLAAAAASPAIVEPAPVAAAPLATQGARAPAAAHIQPVLLPEAVPLPPVKVAKLQPEPETPLQSAQTAKPKRAARVPVRRTSAAKKPAESSGLMSMVRKLITPEKNTRKRSAQVRQPDRHLQH